MCIFHHHTPQTSLNVTLIRAPKDGAIVRNTFIQHSWWHGCKLSRMTKKVICNFKFKNNNNNNCPFFHHYTLSSFFFVNIFCGVMCMCYLSLITFSYICCVTFFKALELKVWSLNIHCRLSFSLACFLIELLCFCNHDHEHCHVPLLFLLPTIAMASFLVGILSVSTQATKMNVVCVIVGPIVGYGSNNNNINWLGTQAS